jgi:NADH-quinone oxidoreductase subunit E
MARLTPENVQRAKDTIALYPEKRSALIPLLHLAQEQDGWLTEDAMAHIGELVDLTPAEVYGTATFYDMLFTEPVGKHLVSICTNIACLLNGGYELLEHAEEKLGVRSGATTPDGQFTLEEVECIALCGEAPCLTVNWRFFGNVSNERFDTLVDDLRAGRLADQVPPHGTLCRVRRTHPLTADVPKEGRGVAVVDSPPPAEAPAPPAEAPAPATETQRGETQPESEAAAERAHAEGATVQDQPGTDTTAEADSSRPQRGGDS